jgi:phage-related protein (TIGR01555 family)
MSDEKNDPASRFDGWYNAQTGLGTSERDKLLSHQFLRSITLDNDTLEALYHEDDLAAKIVHDVVLDAMSNGFELVDSTADSPEDFADDSEELWRVVEEFGVADKTAQGDIWGRLHGDAFVLLGVEGAGEPSQPFDDERMRAGKLKFLTVLDRRDLVIDSYYNDPLADAKYGEPKTYRLNTQVVGRGAQGAVVHETRLIRFSGAMTSLRERTRNGGWNHSVLRRVYAVLQSANSNWQSVASLMTEASVGKWKIKDLAEMTAKSQLTKLQARMEAADMGRAVNRSVLLDAEFEDYIRESTSFSGLPEVIDKTWQRLAAAADMPVTRLMGMSPAGLNATGESDAANWFKRVEVHQEQVIRPRLDRLVRLCARHMGDGDPERWCAKFPPLKQMSAKEQAEIEKIVAEKDKIYVDMGGLLAEEVVISRYGKGAWSPETTIDLEMRKRMLEAESAKAEENAGKPDPDPMALAPGNPQPEESDDENGGRPEAQAAD